MWTAGAESFQRDRNRQNALGQPGFSVLRFTWQDVTGRPHEVVAAVRAMRTLLRDAS